MQSNIWKRSKKKKKHQVPASHCSLQPIPVEGPAAARASPIDRKGYGRCNQEEEFECEDRGKDQIVPENYPIRADSTILSLKTKKTRQY